MTILWVLAFPAIAFAMVGYFVYRWNKGVKAGLFQKVKFPKRKK